MNRPAVLIVDDDPSVTASLELLLGENGYQPFLADSRQAALALVELHRFSLVLQDMNFSRATSGEEGLALLAGLQDRCPDLPVILMTAWGSIELAVRGIRAGAADFITKPWSNQQLLQSIETALSLSAAEPETTESREELDQRLDLRNLIGRDPGFVKVLQTIARVAPTDASVLITGESGTGKELIAEAIHRNSRRAHGPFVKVNLGGISSTLFESEMFGHVKGAFTDAAANRKGRFEVADGGTIFLDEAGEIEASAQVKLLRVLQDRTYEALGCSSSRTVDVRVISATNRDLVKMVESGGFREDLFYRLNLITLQLPPLRDRSSDITLLAHHFLEQARSAYGREQLTLTDAGMRWLTRQRWPGNIRQLRQVVERAVLIGAGDALEVDDLKELEAPSPRAQSLPEPGSMTLDEMEERMIRSCLDHYDANISRVAEALGLSRAALYRKLDRYGLQRNRKPE
jgi:DNA-binding NtrC family response regulator